VAHGAARVRYDDALVDTGVPATEDEAGAAPGHGCLVICDSQPALLASPAVVREAFVRVWTAYQSYRMSMSVRPVQINVSCRTGRSVTVILTGVKARPPAICPAVMSASSV